MWRPLAVILWISLLPLAQIFGQERARTEAILANRFESYVGGYRLHESLAALSESLREPGTKLAVRVCSNRSLRDALAIAAASPVAVHDYIIEAEGYTPERVLLLRANDCVSSNANYTAIELWVVPQDAAPPPSIESFRACQVSIRSLLTRELGESADDYRNGLRQLIATLRERPQAIGLVTGFYYERRRRPLLTVRRSLHEARRLLRQSRIPPDRYIIRLKPWNDVWSPDYPEPSYPAVSTIEVVETCNEG